MKRILMTAVALASMAFAAAPSPAQARTSVGISINIGDPYRGASFRFRSAPDLVLIPATRVYYVDNYDDYYGCDVYRYGSWWYLVDDGYWYRSRHYTGPFYAVSYTVVPRVIYSVGPRYRRHWGGSFAYRSGRWNWYRGRDATYTRSYRDRDGYTRDRVYDDTRTYRDRRDYSGTRDRTWSRDRGTVDRRGDGTTYRDRRDRATDRTRDEQRSGTRERTWRENRDSQDRGNQGDRGYERGNRGNRGDRGEERGNKGGNKGERGRGRGND